MKILVVSCSPREVSCSDALAEAFICGAESVGNEIVHFRLAGKKNLHGCQACKYCFTHEGKCAYDDDIAPIIDQMRQCEMLVLATPTYYYSLPAQTKMVLDRMYSRHGKPLTIRYSALLTALADDESATKILNAQYQIAANYMGWRDLGIVCADGMSGRIPKGHPALKRAEELGKSIR